MPQGYSSPIYATNGFTSISVLFLFYFLPIYLLGLTIVDLWKKKYKKLLARLLIISISLLILWSVRVFIINPNFYYK